MEYNKKFIVWFNKNKNKEEYSKIFNLFFNNEQNCRICNNIIYYYDSTFKINQVTKKLELYKKSCLTFKTLDKKYFLSCCEECLVKKHPEYNTLNKSRVFNQMNYITEYSFNIPTDISLKWKKEKYAITKENLINKNGICVGNQRWNEYCEKQAYSNSFEYKKEKYNWTKSKFDEYNKSRSVTIENLIKRHGEETGLVIWKEYCEKQKYSTSINYFIGKHGLEKGKEIYENFCKKRLIGAGYSEVSKRLFDALKVKLDFISKYSIYFAENEWFLYKKDMKKYYLVDFYIKELNIGIEFNGDIWHANPNKYNENDKPFKFQKDITAKEIWYKDKLKNDFLKLKMKKLIIIWESELYKDGIDKMVDNLIKKIYE